MHNFCISMNWLPWPIVPKRLWPEVRFQPRRAITFDEHQLIIEREKNPERRSFYELCWHLGGSQSDIANLAAEDIDWPNQTIAYARQKTGSLAMIHFGPDIEAVLRRLLSLERCSLICDLFALATAPRSSSNDVKDSASRASPFIPIGLLGRNGPRLAATRNDLHRRHSDTTARPCIGHTRARPR